MGLHNKGTLCTDTLLFRIPSDSIGLIMADKLKVLIIEDDMLMGTLLSEALWRYEFEPILAKDGDEGLKTLEKTLPHLVLLDLILPGINGFEVLERIKSNARTKDIPVIIVSNLGDKSDIERGMKLGAED